MSANKNFGFDPAIHESFMSDPASPDQLAIVWNGNGEAVTATPVPGANPGTFDMDLARLSADSNLVAALKLSRKNHKTLPPLSGHTRFSTVVSDFTERTRILALGGDTLSLNEDELEDWLLRAEREILLGTDNHPVFETSLEETACSVTHLPNGQVAMTEVPRQQVNETRAKVYKILDGQLPEYFNLTIETSLRCVVRYFLNAVPEGDLVLRAGKEKEVTAFLAITRNGFSCGVWSPSTGLFSEYAFLSPKEIKGGATQKKRPLAQPNSEAAEDEERRYQQERLESYIKHAFEQLFLQLSPEKLEQLQLSTYSQMVWAGELGLIEQITPIAAEYSSRTGLEIIQIPVPFDEAVAGGLLLGSFTFGNDRLLGAEMVPPVNLARDIMALADKEEVERSEKEELLIQKKKNQAVFKFFAAPVLTAAVLLAMVANIVRNQTVTLWRDISAEAKTQELKPALDRRKSYEANLKWYQEFVKQVSAIRRQQPVGINLLYELNSNYPFNVDESFYVSDLKLQPNAGVEIKGLARNKDAITSFLRSLEFAGGSGSGTRLFSNLTYEVQESVANQGTPTGQSNIPALAGSTLTTKSAPGVIAWSIKGNYLPMAEFVPPDPTKKPPAQPPGTAPGQTPPATVPGQTPPVAVPKVSP